MATPTGPLDRQLEAVGEAMSALHERYYHRPPGTVECRWMGEDLLACVLGGVYTDVEKTLIELERALVVQDNRNAFQTAMRERFVASVEQLSGRRVADFVSTHSIGPDLQIELFFLAAEPPAAK